MDATTRLDRHLAAVTRRRGSLGAPRVAVSAPSLGFEYRFGDDRPFHVASIGKTVTATLAHQLADTSQLDLDAPLSTLLPAAELEGLLRGEATPAQLLAHTSGVADYFEDRVASGPRMTELLLTEPDRHWTPAALLDFSRERQRPVARPGARFHYSDTGYVLLGRVLEEASGRSWEELVHDRVLDRVGMPDTWLPHRTTPARGGVELAPTHLGRVDISRHRSLTLDWAGGGLASTPADLVAFSRALHGGALVSAAALARMTDMRHTFRPGIRYGSGMMRVDLPFFAPLLRGLPRPVGHLGVLATHRWHDPVHDAEIVMDFAGTGEMVRSFRTLVEIERTLQLLARG
ncbi:serine hydrolase domain-containing protein [Pseudolysinimonas sp.]